MKNKNFLLIIICVLILLANFFLLLTKNNHDSLLKNNYNRLSYNMFQLESITENQFKSNYVCLDKKIKLMTIEGDSVCLEQIVRGKDKFAIRFNDAGCSSCIEDFRNHISQIQQLIENLGSDNVILFLNTRNPRDLSVFKKQYDLKCNIFALEAGALPTQMEAGDEIVTYYYFIINQNYAVTECFVSIKELVERTQWYFDSIIRKFKYQTVRIVD